MTLFALRNQSYVGEVGTAVGWSELAAHLRSLDPEEFANVAHLAEYGWSRFWVETREELRIVLQEHKPRRQSVAQTLADLVRNLDEVAEVADNDVLIITDGFGD